MKPAMRLQTANVKARRRAGARPRILPWIMRGLTCFACLATGSCDKATQDNQELIVVFAASSVADVLREIADRFEAGRAARIAITQGASGSLCKQLELGAPCDIYLPADPAYLDRLQDRDIVLGATRRKLAGNELVVVRSGADAKTWTTPDGLLDVGLGPISMASPEHAPAGRFAMLALKNTGLWDRIASRVIYADNVRLAGRYVAVRGAQVGIVYATDALAFSGEMSVVYRFPHGAHAEIIYEAAACARSTRRSEASDFIEFAASESAGEIWRRHGFVRDAR